MRQLFKHMQVIMMECFTVKCIIYIYLIDYRIITDRPTENQPILVYH